MMASYHIMHYVWVYLPSVICAPGNTSDCMPKTLSVSKVWLSLHASDSAGMCHLWTFALLGNWTLVGTLHWPLKTLIKRASGVLSLTLLQCLLMHYNRIEFPLLTNRCRTESICTSNSIECVPLLIYYSQLPNFFHRVTAIIWPSLLSCLAIKRKFYSPFVS